MELPLEQSFHESEHDTPHPLDDVNVMISGGMGMGLQARLKQKGILAVATAETDLEHAVAAWLAGTLVELPPDMHLPGHHHDRPMAVATLGSDTLFRAI